MKLILVNHSKREKTAGGDYPATWTYRLSNDGDLRKAKLPPGGSIQGGFLRFNTFVRGDKTFTPLTVTYWRKLTASERVIPFNS